MRSGLRGAEGESAVPRLSSTAGTWLSRPSVSERICVIGYNNQMVVAIRPSVLVCIYSADSALLGVAVMVIVAEVA